MNTDVVVTAESQLAEVPSLNLITKERLQMLKEQRALFIDFVKSQMIPKIDFGRFGNAPKDTLLKPGAEKLCRLFGLGFRIKKEEDKVDVENRLIICSKTIEVYSLSSGKVLAECQGSQNSREPQFRNKDPFAIMNTLQKMAQKRAFVGAVIAATGASEIFTQDLDDDEAPAPKKEADPNCISKEDYEAFVTLYKAAGWSPKEVADLMKTTYGKMRGSDLLHSELDKLFKYIEAHSKEVHNVDGPPIGSDADIANAAKESE